MLVAVISDSHKHSVYIEETIKKVKNVEMLIHLGDNVQDVEKFKINFKGPIISVSGNCDFNSCQPSEKTQEIQGKKFLITHGHRYGVKDGLNNIRYRALELGVDVVLFGHTHSPMIEFIENIWYINPGSVSVPRGRINTFAFIDIDKDGNIKPSIVEV